MPIYEYECRECGIRFDKLQRFGDPQPETCPNGHKQVHRLLGPPAIIFKGSGFYVTDNGPGRRNGTSARKSHKDKETAPASSSKTDKEATS